ncbi:MULTISPECIES: hypothetical protein [unclassified Mesorhizobium]|uniref:hypothetical protein n=1 Tax=unclassified Mesorhizobium TaxID=325217 RepID=UPI000FD9E99A|nr:MULTISPECIES: hypothetical protein [unclassified Mesorhizobium]TGQ38544.1 hypothetical protein EN859_016875 [Mesorhizobium sp. M00.F.Ca.ET.216.01.1.1]TIS60226.1 MAG: hypothetical protein E5W91_01330 [Mesorhizobium sp.]TIS91300.1 MAG: hypothetical protein E5W89_07030 [Mesorhizobium sp.]TJW04646.1 MAG: hypothetical protein E5W82_30615 [Mesorhizobium sp.]TJW42804.1 MAG: hypothetical protein E5W83_19640 [Mesorhizobium sp.]
MTTVQEKLFPVPVHGWFSRLARGFVRHAAKKRAYLDVRELPPHLQRDMGFLDGNDPCGRRQ